MKAKTASHTPGPWKESQSGDKYYINKANQRKEFFPVALVYDNADARLIAAAPELLRYLKLAEEVLRFCGNDTSEIKAIIAEAGGNSHE